ncbi:fluoride efflux transporter CrcB [Rhodobacteraceae bacterium]|nr:fluoride efflux transporter CrcB [Paracoccaceae bacterium]
MFGTLISVAVGGAIGASLRYLTGVWIVRLIGVTSFPVSIIAVNILGSFLMGVFVVLAARLGLNHLSPFLMTGFLGGFTTFSSFSLEAVTLYERGDVMQAGLYVGLSVVVSILGLMIGMVVTRAVLA